MLKAMLRHLGAGPPERILAIGGSTRNQLLMRLKASVYGAPLAVMDLADTTCLGAALLGGMAGGRVQRTSTRRAATLRRAGARRGARCPAWSEDHRQRRQTTYAAAYAACARCTPGCWTAEPVPVRIRPRCRASCLCRGRAADGDRRHALADGSSQRERRGSARHVAGRARPRCPGRRHRRAGHPGDRAGRHVPGRRPVDHPEQAAGDGGPGAGGRAAPAARRRRPERQRVRLGGAGQTEDTWTDIFGQGGQRYQKPHAGAVRRPGRVRLRPRRAGHRAVLLPGRPQGLSRPLLLRRARPEVRRARRLRPGLCGRPRGRPSRPDPARHLAPGDAAAPAEPTRRPPTGCR